MNAGKNTIPDISANVLCAEKNNGCICSEKSDNRSCDKLDQYRDDQAKSNGDHHGIAKCLLCTVILSGTDILSCECRNSRKHGRRNQEQKADDFFHNADSSGCVQSAPVGNDRNNNESNLNKSVLKRYRNPNIQNFAKRFFCGRKQSPERESPVCLRLMAISANRTLHAWESVVPSAAPEAPRWKNPINR